MYKVRLLIVTILFIFSVTKLQTKYREEKIDKMDNKRTQAIDSLMNFETVKYFNNEEHEMNRYKKAIAEYQKSDKTLTLTHIFVCIGESIINNSGYLAGSLLTASMVAKQLNTVGKKHLLWKMIIESNRYFFRR